MSDNYEAVSGTVMGLTAKAVLFDVETMKEEHWIPMSVIFEDDLAELDIGLFCEINVASWFYDKEIG